MRLPSFVLTRTGPHPHHSHMGRVPPWKRPPVPAHPDQARIIREARERDGWGQRKLAATVGISQPHLCRLENGKAAPSPKTARRLSEVLHVEVPLPLIDIAQTATGRMQARERDRQRMEHIAQLQREVAELENAARMTRTIWPRFTFGRRF